MKSPTEILIDLMNENYQTGPTRITAARALLEHEDRERSRVMKVILALLALALVAILAGLSAGCGSWKAPAGVPRTDSQQQRSAVMIESACLFQEMHGSGVRTDEIHVLTAAHVLRCPLDPLIRVTFSEGTRAWARVARTDDELDLALLELLPDITRRPRSTAPELARVHLNELICAATAVPERRWSCGRVFKIKDEESGFGDVFHKARSVRGNSGSGVYNTEGQLIGIVTNLLPCPNGKDDGSCGGRFTSLWGRGGWL